MTSIALDGSLEIALQGVIKGAIETSRSAFTLDELVHVLLTGVQDQCGLLTSVSGQVDAFSNEISALTAVGAQLEAGAEQDVNTAEELAHGQTAFVGRMERVAAYARETRDLAVLLDADALAIRQVMGLVTGIISQTKILAINAAIEAARVGAVGRGFGVVAAELQKLGEQTARAVQEVGEVTQGLRQRIDYVNQAALRSQEEADSAAREAQVAQERLGELVASAQQGRQAATGMRSSLGRQAEAAESLRALVREMETHQDVVRGQAESAHVAVTGLHRVVNDLTTQVGGFQLGAHDRALGALLELVALQGLGHRGSVTLEGVLSGAFAQYPMFELFYVLDTRGIQVSANIPNAAYASQISTAGRGVNRSHRPYWREVMETGHGYVSPIYRSTATQNFCVTVSCPLRDQAGKVWGVLAGDVAIADLLHKA